MHIGLVTLNLGPYIQMISLKKHGLLIKKASVTGNIMKQSFQGEKEPRFITTTRRKYS